MLPITADLRSINPRIQVEPPGTAVAVSLTMTIHGEFEQVVLHSNLRQMKVGDDTLAVFFDPGDMELANVILAELNRMKNEVHQLLGVEPESWAVSICNKRKLNVLYVAVPAHGYQSTWICFRDEWKNGSFPRANVHEWVESTLESHLSIEPGSGIRFLGDGLAEFASWRLYGLTLDYSDCLTTNQTGEATIDLLDRFRSIPGSAFDQLRFDSEREVYACPEGYPLSFVFWHELIRRHGAQLPSILVARLDKNSPATAETVIDALVELTGDNQLEAKLRNIDVARARSSIDQLYWQQAETLPLPEAE